jgi:ATP-dependent helicase/nuclease subunit B
MLSLAAGIWFRHPVRTIHRVVEVDWVRYGREAADALRTRIVDVKGADPLTPVTVVVPSNHVGVATRRLLASGVLGPTCSGGVGLAAVTFVTPYRLAELLGAPRLAGAGRRPVSTPVIAAALRAALAEDAGLFAPVAAHEATETALVTAYRELREVSPGGLDALARTSPRAGDVVRLHRDARRRLEREWYDEQDLMVASAEVLRAGAGDHGLGSVIVFLPQRLSRHAAALLAAVAEVTDLAVLTGSTGVAAADAELAEMIRLVGADAPEPTTFDPHADVDPDRTRIVLASDADDEVRVAVRDVVDAVRDGTPLDRIAVLYATSEPYGRLLHDHLAAGGIAANGPAVVPLAGRVVGRLLLDLLALPERGFRRQDVFAWLTSAPVLVAGRWASTGAWERLSREAGVVAGRRDWHERLAAIVEANDTQADAVAADPDQPAWREERLRRDADHARQLRELVVGLIDDLAAAAAAPRRWGEHAAWARRHVDSLLGGLGRREQWPDAERKAADRVDAALDRLAALDGIEGPVGLDVFRRTLALELDSDLGRVGRFGEGVFVGPVAMGIGLDLDVVIVLGLTEGTYPAPVRDDSLLPDHEREAAAGDLPLRRSRVDRQHRELLATLATAPRWMLGVPIGDLRRSTERVPSRWVLDVASALVGTTWWAEDLQTADVEWVEHTGSFAAGVRRLRFPATAQEHRLRSLMVVAPSRTDDLAAVDDPVLAAGATMVAARRGADFTRFDGNLAGLPVPSPADGVTSATRIERWAGCPFAYLVQDVFGIDAVENPEDRLEITALDRGSLVHEVLERFILEVLARGPEGVPEPDAPWSAADRARMAEIGRELCDEYEARGLTGRPIFWRDRARILADLERFLDGDDLNRRTHRTRPVAAELAFGLREATVEAVPFTLPDTRQLRFRGKADRLDVGDDGTLHIVDYKTGGFSAYQGISEENPDDRGRRLQLAVYGAAARQHRGAPDAAVRAEYWFISTKGQFKRKGYPVTDAVLARACNTMGTIVAGIEAGVFASHPTEISSAVRIECAACDPDGLGTTELRRAWERKRSSPALAPYAELAEPLDEADAEVEELSGD